jgi:hypothetical protein
MTLDDDVTGNMDGGIGNNSKWAIGTRVAKQFDDGDGNLKWFEGTLLEYHEDYHWIVYSDGDSEDLDANEMQQAVENYRLHVQSEVEMCGKVQTLSLLD